MAEWQNGRMEEWRNGRMADGRMIVRQSRELASLGTGRLELWQKEIMAEWQNEPLPPSPCTPSFPPGWSILKCLRGLQMVTPAHSRGAALSRGMVVGMRRTNLGEGEGVVKTGRKGEGRGRKGGQGG